MAHFYGLENLICFVVQMLYNKIFAKICICYNNIFKLLHNDLYKFLTKTFLIEYYLIVHKNFQNCIAKKEKL